MDWEHRFEPDLPLYMQVSREDCVLHLSEHFGDGTPGACLFLPMQGVREYERIPVDGLKTAVGFYTRLIRLAAG